MRCSVCGRNSKFHTFGDWAIQKKVDGKWTIVQGVLVDVSKCYAIQFFQSALISGMGELRKVKV